MPNCLPQCDGKFCGDDNCGGTCGACGAGEICTPLSRCQADPCVPECTDRECGPDGCGGSCGACAMGSACDDPNGLCRAVVACDHEKPTCRKKCGGREYCGTDCACHKSSDLRPDLVVNRVRLQNGWRSSSAPRAGFRSPYE